MSFRETDHTDEASGDGNPVSNLFEAIAIILVIIALLLFMLIYL